MQNFRTRTVHLNMRHYEEALAECAMVESFGGEIPGSEAGGHLTATPTCADGPGGSGIPTLPGPLLFPTCEHDLPRA